MFEIAEAGSVAVALTGAVLGWSLRPVFLRHRRAVVVAAAVLAAAGAAAYDAFEAAPVHETRAPVVERTIAPPAAAPALASAPAAPSGETWADYLDRAGRDAYAEGDYAAASKYWLDASRMSPGHAASLADAIARAQRLAADRL